jgi:hypothetical protein
MQTAVEQTMAARGESSGESGGENQGEASEGGESGGEVVSTTAVPPSATMSPPTLTFTPSATPTFTMTPTITFTPTPDKPMVSVTVDTNCRVGPGKVYDRVGALLVGEEAEVIAKDPQGLYWYIRNPDRPGEFCWLWGNYATTTGNTSSLPVFTPPPTPTASIGFAFSFYEIDNCGALWYIEFYIQNTGGIVFQSVRVRVTDNTTAQTVTVTSNQFTDWNGCVAGTSQSDLTAGEAGYTTSGALNNNPNGHNIDVTITGVYPGWPGGNLYKREQEFCSLIDPILI